MDIFDEIYALAISMDRNALLNKLKEKNVSVDVVNHQYTTPLMKLAENENHAAVNFLLTKFDANINYAVCGYAKIGLHDKVNQLIENGAHVNWAVWGYALGKHDALVKELLDKGANRDWANWGTECANSTGRRDYHPHPITYVDNKAWGFTSNAGFCLRLMQDSLTGDHLSVVDKTCYLTDNEIRLHADEAAVIGYAAGGYYHQVESMSSSHTKRATAKGYIFINNLIKLGGLYDGIDYGRWLVESINKSSLFNNEKSILKFLTGVPERYRKEATNDIVKFLNLKEHNYENLLSLTTLIAQHMNNSQLSFENAYLLAKFPEAHALYLSNDFSSGYIPKEVVDISASYLLDEKLSQRSLKEFLQVVSSADNEIIQIRVKIEKLCDNYLNHLVDERKLDAHSQNQQINYINQLLAIVRKPPEEKNLDELRLKIEELSLIREFMQPSLDFTGKIKNKFRNLFDKTPLTWEDKLLNDIRKILSFHTPPNEHKLK